MEAQTLKEVQKAEIDITKEIFDICRKHQLKCSLVGGSAIGAIRHQGIIPWDDDVDLAMPRSDFNKFCSVCKKELPEHLFLQYFGTEPNCAFIFAKVRKNHTYFPETYSKDIKMHQGIWVDIFIYDKVSDDEKTRLRENQRIQFLKNLLIVKVGYKLPENAGFIVKLLYYPSKLLALFTNKKKLQKKLVSLMSRHESEQTKYIIPYAGAYGFEKELMPSDLFEDLIDVKFNGYDFMIFKEYDLYLKSIYGDYMKLPPVEKRTGGNHFLDDSEIKL